MRWKNTKIAFRGAENKFILNVNISTGGVTNSAIFCQQEVLFDPLFRRTTEEVFFLPIIPPLLPVPTIPVLRWRTGGDGGGARPRTVKTTMNLVLVPRVEGLGPQHLRTEEKTPNGRKRQQRRRSPRAMWSRSV